MITPGHYDFQNSSFDIDNQGNIISGGHHSAIIDLNTGQCFGLGGDYIGEINVDNRGVAGFTHVDGHVEPGNLSRGSSAPPARPAPTQGSDPIVGSINAGTSLFYITSKGRFLDANKNDIGHLVTDANGGYNYYGSDGIYLGNISPQGAITTNEGVVLQENAHFDIYEVPDYVADITKGDGSIIHLGNNGQIYDDNNQVIGNYQTSVDGRNYSLFNPDGSNLGNVDAATGTMTNPDGSTSTGHFTPRQYTPPLYAPTTTDESSSSSTTGTLTQQERAGIDWSSPVASALQAGIISEAQALPGYAKQAGVQAQDKYKNLMYGIGLPTFQSDLNALAGRNMINTSVAESTLANAQQQANQAIAQQAFDASLAGTQMQMKVPGELSNIVGSLGGKVGTSTGTETGTKTTTGKGGIYDPLAPYRLMGNLSY